MEAATAGISNKCPDHELDPKVFGFTFLSTNHYV